MERATELAFQIISTGKVRERNEAEGERGWRNQGEGGDDVLPCQKYIRCCFWHHFLPPSQLAPGMDSISCEGNTVVQILSHGCNDQGLILVEIPVKIPVEFA